MGTIQVKNAKSKAPWVEALRISPDNSKLAVGAHGGLAWIDVCTIGPGLTLKKDHANPQNAGSTAVTAMDFNLDGSIIAVTAGAPSFFDIGANKITFPANVKDEKWADWTCK
jgi:hypothetical protein